MISRSLRLLSVYKPTSDRFVVTFAIQGGHLPQGVCDVKVGVIDPYRESQPLRSVDLVDTSLHVERLQPDALDGLPAIYHAWHPIDPDFSACERCLVDLLSRL